MAEERLVMHETAGVCRITGETSLEGMDGVYYVLTPLYLSRATFYTPKETRRSRFRPLMSAQEAQRLVEQLEELPAMTFENANDQKARSAAVLKSGDSYLLAQLTKALYQDQQRRSMQNRRTVTGDNTALKRAEMLLFGELASALGLEYDQVLPYIHAHFKHNK